MSVQAMTWVLEQSDARLGDRLVLLSIANHAHADGSNAFPSYATIAGEAHMSVRQVKRAIKRMTGNDPKFSAPSPRELLVKVGASRYGTNLYELPLVRPSGGGDKKSPPEIQRGLVTSSPEADDNSRGESDGNVTRTVISKPSMNQHLGDAPTGAPSHEDTTNLLLDRSDFDDENPRDEDALGAARRAAKSIRDAYGAHHRTLAGLHEEIEWAALAYRDRYPDMRLTPSGLEVHWAEQAPERLSLKSRLRELIAADDRGPRFEDGIAQTVQRAESILQRRSDLSEAEAVSSAIATWMKREGVGAG